ncbi:MAG: MoaD/ThiS family protein [Nanoarchaeota archaeon]|nr:MoaD/ThiS family protein [Nanoarchaeota archaeon]
MEINIFIEKENRTDTVNFNKSLVSDLLKEMNINPETVIVVRDGEVITEKEILKDKDKIELLSVISGG